LSNPILLDTGACLWLVAGTLPQESLRLLTDTYNDGLKTYVSPVTALEIGTLARQGQFKSRLPTQLWLSTLMSLPGMAIAQMPPDLLLESALLPGVVQGDNADRIVAATARAYGFTVMTRDPALLDYARQGYLNAIAC
jgi:PIN domain nuclease of toxin-antitoxin system